jgi:3-isopropylmalate/(R)-2-methylmalate dehydratase small subunit
MQNQSPPHSFSSRIVTLEPANIDTDQIIPARFLTTTTKAGLGQFAFCDWRYDQYQNPITEFPLNQIDPSEHQFLLAGDNFGCGSSREHAPWALIDFGFKAIISTSIADIFSSNALKNGLLPIVLSAHEHALIKASPHQRLTIDIVDQSVTLEDGTVFFFPLEPFAKQCLMEGVDAIGYLLNRLDKITAFERENCL